MHTHMKGMIDSMQGIAIWITAGLVCWAFDINADATICIMGLLFASELYYYHLGRSIVQQQYVDALIKAQQALETLIEEMERDGKKQQRDPSE